HVLLEATLEKHRVVRRLRFKPSALTVSDGRYEQRERRAEQDRPPQRHNRLIILAADVEEAVMSAAPGYPRSVENGSGERLVFLGIERTPEGERINIAGSARPGAGPPMHIHYLQDEIVTVDAGRVGYQVLGQEAKFAGPGETVTWPAGTPHR